MIPNLFENSLELQLKLVNTYLELSVSQMLGEESQFTGGSSCLSSE